jgi:hypothetical protein
LQCRKSWLHAIPSPNIGTLLDNTSFQVCIRLILGCNLCTPHICQTKPNGLSRDDGKRPDGIKGQPLVWDVTVVDTLADSYVLKTSEVCKRKHSKYSSIISSNYVFKGLAFETLDPWCKEAIDFINVIGIRKGTFGEFVFFKSTFTRYQF